MAVRDDEGFVVHRGKGVPTLSSMNEPLMPARLRQAKEKTNNDSKADERGKFERRIILCNHLVWKLRRTFAIFLLFISRVFLFSLFLLLLFT